MWTQTPKGIILTIKIIPNAGRNEIVGWENGSLKIRIAAQPEKGKANDALISFLSKDLKMSKQQITIISGHHSRNKKICLSETEPRALWFLHS